MRLPRPLLPPEPEHGIAPDGHSCVWMRAGVVSYRLCNLRFDCDHCLLDAALRGALAATQPISAVERGDVAGPMRDDRLYADGHLWVQPLDDRRACRVGLDPFAAALLGSVSAVSWRPSESLCERNDPICTLDLGAGQLTLGAPLRGRLACRNEALQRHPALLLSAPYDEGWLVELALAEPADFQRLDSAAAAESRTAADLRRFRRAVARRLLADLEAESPTATGAPRHLADLRQLLAGDHYLDLIAPFVH